MTNNWTNTIYLRADSLEDFIEALPADWISTEDGQIIAYTDKYALDLIGKIVTVPAVADEEGNITTPAEYDNRFHANLKLNGIDLPDSLKSLQVEVSSPSRDFA